MNIVVPEGTVILQEGEVNLDLYKIISGNIEIYTGYGTPSECLLGLIKKGSYIGELGFFTGRPSVYTAITYNESEICRIPIYDLKAYLQYNTDDAIMLMKNMADTIYNMQFNLGLMQKEISENVSLQNRGRENLAKQMLKYNMGLTKAIADYNIRNKKN